MRLPPFLAGLAALGLFWRLASSILSPLAVLFAVGLLAAARWPITMGAFVKPDSFDLLMALVLLLPAVEWLRRPLELRWPLVLAVVAPVALPNFYLAAFIAGGVSLAPSPTAWRSRWAGRTLFIAYNVFIAVTLLLFFTHSLSNVNTRDGCRSTGPTLSRRCHCGRC